MPQPGRRVNLFVNVATPGSPSFIVAGQGTGLSETKQRDVQRVSHKDSNESVPISGNITRSFNVTGFYFRNDAGQAALDAAFENDTEKQFLIKDTGTGISQFMGKCTSISREHGVDGASTYTVTLEPTETPYNPGS